MKLLMYTFYHSVLFVGIVNIKYICSIQRQDGSEELITDSSLQDETTKTLLL